MRIEFTDGPLKGESFEVNKDRVVLGRDKSCDVVVPDDEVSREHAELTLSGDRVEVRDLGSQNGTKVGRSQVTDAREVSSSDEISIGESVFKVDAGVGAAATRGGGRTRAAGGTASGTRMAGSVPAMLEVVSGPDKGKTIDVTAKGVTVGRDSKADFTLADDETSREHVEVRANPDGSVEVRDLGSRNGTEVNGKKISRTVNVSDGAEIRIGRSTLKVSSIAGAKRGGPLTGVGAGRRPGVGAIAAVVGGLAAVVIVLLVTGVFGGGDDDGGEEASGPLTIPEIVEKATPSTVQILGRLGGGRTASLGTGWIYDAAKGLVVTNSHVVSCCEIDGEIFPVNSYAVSIDKFPRRADIYAVAPCEDLAILRTAPLTQPDMELADSQDDLSAGDQAIVFGYPGNFTLEQPAQVTEGTVSVAKTQSEALEDPDFPVYQNVIQTDAAINSGQSGGPLLNDQGQLIGVTTFSATEREQNFAVGVDQVREVLEQMAEGDSLQWAGFGFEGTGTGLVVLNVIPNTGSDNAGLAPSEFVFDPVLGPLGFEQIRAINNRPVSTREDYCNATENLSSGEGAVARLGFAGKKAHGRVAKGRIVFE